jgi:hypothetical protein
MSSAVFTFVLAVQDTTVKSDNKESELEEA